MYAIEPYRSVAQKLRSKIFEIGYDEYHFGTSGFFKSVEKMIRGVFNEQKIFASDDLVRQIAHNFPLIDVEPEIWGHDDTRLADEEIEQVSEVLAHALPDLK